MHVLITGGAGFIGSNLSAEFLRAGERVTILDTLQRPGSHLNLTWLRELAKRDQLTLLCGDVRQGASRRRGGQRR